MVSVSNKIQSLYNKAKKLKDDGDYKGAKNCFLDAASLALDISKKSENRTKMKYEALTTKFINKAKEMKKLEQLGDELPVPKINIPTPSSDVKNRKIPVDKEAITSIFDNYSSLRKEKMIKIPLGINTEEEKIEYWEPENEMNGFVMITGGSGSGKTEGLRGIVTELIERGYPCTVLDLHGDIDLSIPTISLDYRGHYAVNPMTITTFSEIEGGPLPKINELLDTFGDAVEDSFSSVQKNMLRKLLIQAYEKQGISQKKYDSWKRNPPTFIELLNMLEKKLTIADGREIGTINALIARLTIILEHPAFSGDVLIPVDKLLEFPIRILLKPLRSLSMQFLAADTIMRQIFSHVKSIGHVSRENNENKFRLFIIIDEVKILMGYQGKPNDPHHILNILATEGRKFGIGLILASQVASHYGKDIKSNTATKIILKPMDSEQAKLNSKEINVNAKTLMQLKLPGEGYLRTSSKPTSRKIRLFPSNKRPYLSNDNNSEIVE